jgi:hypothetical protein
MSTISYFKKNIKKSKYLNLLNFRLSYPENKFVIYTRGRTGSTLLTELLNCHPDIYCDVEIFNFLYSEGIVKFPNLYIKNCSKRASSYKKSTYGFKVKIAQLRHEHKYDKFDNILTDLHSDGWKFIHLKRMNFLRHKLSNIVASSTNIFHINNSNSERPGKIKVNCNELIEGIKYSEKVEHEEEESLRKIPHLKLIYENDILDNSKHQETADKVFNFLNVKSCSVKTELKRIVPENLEDSILNFEEVYTSLKGTKYSKYLNLIL